MCVCVYPSNKANENASQKNSKRNKTFVAHHLAHYLLQMKWQWFNISAEKKPKKKKNKLNKTKTRWCRRSNNGNNIKISKLNRKEWKDVHNSAMHRMSIGWFRLVALAHIWLGPHISFFLFIYIYVHDHIVKSANDCKKGI